MAKYIKRGLEATLTEAANNFPALVITGARQTGKSTLVTHLFPDAKYISFDDLAIKNYAKEDPKAFLDEIKEQVILDEIQEVPELLSYIKIEIDKNREAGKFIITGSQQFSLMEGVQESLAGRAAVIELAGFSLKELGELTLKFSWEELVYRGFYPELWMNKTINSELWYGSYIKTFIDRDITKHLRDKNIFNYSRLIELLATRVSQELNFSSLSKELGLDLKTVQTWVSFLIRSQIIFLIPPYYKNLGKRITKKPKLYFYDPGLVAYLTRHKTPELVRNGPMGGALYENFVISEIMKQNLVNFTNNQLFYFRENNGLELDLIIDSPTLTSCFEIKSTMTPNLGHTKNLTLFSKLFDSKTQLNLICPAKTDLNFRGVQILNHQLINLENLLS
ncbi:MAG: ATP-binding protein [Candidatus Caenarcaniphilales bacterium]|nr:ATP-binding protein [Candidatus Caenarcaniphilales bacterium]